MREPKTELDPRVKSMWRLSRMVRLALTGIIFSIILGFGVGWIFETLFQFPSFPISLGVIAFYLFFRLFHALVWPMYEYRYYKYGVNDDHLLVQRGVLFRRWSAIPHHRIQHVDTHQGPIERMFGIASLQMYTAAGQSADGSIPGLTEKVAEQLRDDLSRRRGDDGV